MYYESIEQAYHFVLPIIQKIIGSLAPDVQIKLVRMSKDYTHYSRKVAPIIFWKEPDILMTAIQHNGEYPLLLIEFSTAVFTEDHELQRFDGMVTAARNNCVYTKISPTEKVSPTEHGGKVEFDYSKPFSLIYTKYGLPYFHFEWECDEKGVVEVDPEYLSCPQQIKEFELLLEAILGEIIKNGYSDGWIKKVTTAIQSRTYFRQWLDKLKSTSQIDVTTLYTSRTRWIERDPTLNSGILELKLNRFGHAMDPERGMLAYYGSLTTKLVSKMMFSEDKDAWYKDIPKEEEIKRYIQRNGLVRAYDFLYCFALGSSLFNNKDFMKIVKKHEKSNANRITIDLTDFIQKNFPNLSKPLKTIFVYSMLFAIEDDSGKRKIIFKWRPYQEPEFFKGYSRITQITERTTLDEDDVTYIAVHNILKPNGYKIVAVSYPGAQADRRILVEPGTGRRQPREYIDIISFLPKKATSLQENQGSYASKKFKSDVNELSLYKKEPTYIKGLRNFQERYAPESLDTSTKIGVGFWAHRAFTVSHIKKLDLRDLDYFVYITNDRKGWKIWRTGKDNMFSITSGKVSILKTYEVAEDASTVELSKFF